jgi:hypothetical protein
MNKETGRLREVSLPSPPTDDSGAISYIYGKVASWAGIYRGNTRRGDK